MKRKKISKDKRYEQSKFYQIKAGDMECLALTLGVIGYFLQLPVLIVLDLVGMPEHDANEWSWVAMAPSLICGWIGLYFNFRSWLADPYKNI